jgi:Ca2+-binding RTX toxin-like protein
MATLTVSASHDYSTDVLADVDSLLFTTAAIATFSGGEFVSGVISPNVAITGNAGTNGLFINASGFFSMAGWTFSTWTAADTITVNGSAGADTITGSSQADTIFGGDGTDTLAGGDGNDILVAHTLANLFAQEHDVLSGGLGNDTIYGEAADTLSGGAGFDVLQVINDFAVNLDLVATGFEYVLSGFGDDVYSAALGSTAVEVYASGGNDSILGGSGNDNLWGGVGNDMLMGDDGDDLLVGDLGADFLSGGPGNDRLYIDSDDTFIDGGFGFDAAYIATGTGVHLNLAITGLEWVADFVGGNDTIDGSSVFVNLEIYGAGGTDTIIGGFGADFLWGGSGDDTVTGNGGDDTLVGELGADRLTGGAGNDALYGNSGNGGDGAVDTFVFTNSWGTDFVFDFEHGIDKLDMTGVLGVHSMSDLTITSSGGNAVISFGSDHISVAGQAGQITQEDFLFDSVPSIFITEVMVDPAQVPDAVGEWFEITNFGGSPVDLNGWTIKIGSDSIVVNNGGPLIVGAGGVFVFAASGDPATNGGLPSVGYATGFLGLNNTADSIQLFDQGDNLIAEVDYDASWPYASGASMAVALGKPLNGGAASWDTSTSTYGLGDHGTPGSFGFF